MTLEEFSNQFDLLVSSYRRFKDFDKQEELDSIEFDEYEKSVFLTKAQEELVISFYTGKNPYGESFESTEELRRYLADLVVDKEEELLTNSSNTPLGGGSNHYFFSLPDDPKPWYIIYESVDVGNGGENPCGETGFMDVVPVRHDEYNKLRKNPFRGANSRRALRLDLSDGIIEIVCKKPVTKYHLRYLRKPLPIVLENMPNNVTIDGIGTSTSCELHEALHEKILEYAVAIALKSKGYNVDKPIENKQK